jgi:dTDP-4-dehydrorhamnose 3,5-epimerase
LRGLHYQVEHTQGKLVRVTAAKCWTSRWISAAAPAFGQWVGCACRPTTRQLWIPGFAHGFVVLSDYAEFLYKTTDYYNPRRALHPLGRPDLNIDWQFRVRRSFPPRTRTANS